MSRLQVSAYWLLLTALTTAFGLAAYMIPFEHITRKEMAFSEIQLMMVRWSAYVSMIFVPIDLLFLAFSKASRKRWEIWAAIAIHLVVLLLAPGEGY